MNQLEGKLVEVLSHRYDTPEVFRVLEVRPSIGFLKVVLNERGDGTGGFWVEIEAVRPIEPQAAAA